MADSFEIKVRIHDESELYNSFDEERQVLSTDVMDYIYYQYQKKGLGEKLVIHIVSDSPIIEKNFHAAFKSCFAFQQEQLKRTKRKNLIKQLWMFGIGVLFIGVGLLLADRLPALTGEIISTIGAFSMWEAAGIWIVENPGNRIKQRWIELLLKTEFKYSIEITN